MNNFSVKTEVFNGPLDLLLSLIEKRKLLINEISLAKITDDYIVFLNQEKNQSLRENANFILIASTLLLIKSKSLLPGIELNEEEKQSVEDLETRLKIYQKIKELEPWIEQNFMKKTLFSALERKSFEIVFTPTKNISLPILNQAILELLKTFPQPKKIPHKNIKKIKSLEETIQDLTNKIKKVMTLNFNEFIAENKSEKINVVINFLAMLELVKQGTICALQDDNCGNIEIQSREIDVPNYS